MAAFILQKNDSLIPFWGMSQKQPPLKDSHSHDTREYNQPKSKNYEIYLA
jgi:hypothetical protein